MAKKKSKKMAKKEDVLAVEPVDAGTSNETEDKQGLRQVCFENRIPKRNIFLADHYRDERDAKVFENKIREIGRQNYKRNVLCVTKIKHMVVDDKGDWLTTFIINLKG